MIISLKSDDLGEIIKKKRILISKSDEGPKFEKLRESLTKEFDLEK